MGFLHLRELSPGPECPKWGHCHQIQVSPRAVTAPLRGRDTQIQVLVPTLKGHGGSVPGSHTGPPGHLPANAHKWQAVAGAQGHGLHADHGWAAEGSAQVPGARADLAAATQSTCPGSPASPHRGQSPLPPASRLGTGHRVSGRGGRGLPLLQTPARLRARPPAPPALTHHCG